MINRLFPISVIVLISIIFGGCFTGIESTPKITADDVKREKILETPEQLFLKGIKGQKFIDWQPGKTFFVTDDKISLIFGASKPADIFLKGKRLKYIGNDVVNSVTGGQVVDLLFSAIGVDSLRYRINISPNELLEKESVEVPFTIEETLVEEIRNLMKGKTLYVLTSTWIDSIGNKANGRKYIPVNIVDVQPGNNVYPIKVFFSMDENQIYGLYMSAGTKSLSARAFDSLFAFENPHNKYPEISDETWQNIINGNIALDMTREECRLALGAPDKIDRRPGYGGVQERWSYENGVYLIFEDGLLRDFRK